MEAMMSNDEQARAWRLSGDESQEWTFAGAMAIIADELAQADAYLDALALVGGTTPEVYDWIGGVHEKLSEALEYIATWRDLATHEQEQG
jgi:hypothetical protein